MRKIVLFLLALLLSITSLFAFSDQLRQFDTAEWLELEEAIKCNKDRSTVDTKYSQYIEADVSEFEKARAEYLYSRYLVDNGYKDEA